MTRIAVELRRAELLQAALRVMARDGLTAGTTRAVVAEAGMSLASFHYCLWSRDELLGELIVLVTGLEQAAADRVLAPAALLGRTGPGPGPPADSAAETPVAVFRVILRRALTGYLRRLTEDPGYQLFRLELRHYALPTPELSGSADDQYQGYYLSPERLLTVVA